MQVLHVGDEVFGSVTMGGVLVEFLEGETVTTACDKFMQWRVIRVSDGSGCWKTGPMLDRRRREVVGAVVNGEMAVCLSPRIAIGASMIGDDREMRL